MQAIPLYIITGFLGSGKTSVILSLLEQLKGRKIGLIMNDFGQLGIDSSLVPESEGIHTRELKGGQIFCSCLSGSFVDTVVGFQDSGIDLLLVEASGLSKPAPLLEIIHWVGEKSGGSFSYQGMLCVLDAQRHLVLSKSLKTLEEQMIFSDLFIVNKSDQADDQTLSQVEAHAASLQPTGRIIRTSFGKVTPDVLDLSPDVKRLESLPAEAYRGWQQPGRPKSFVLEPVAPVSLESLKRFVEDAAPSCYRIKGYVITDQRKPVYVSAVGASVEITPVPPGRSSVTSALVCLQKANGTGDKVFPARWRLFTGKPVRVIGP